MTPPHQRKRHPKRRMIADLGFRRIAHHEDKHSEHESKTSELYKMRALVLFSGTGSVDRSLEAAGFTVDNLDIDPKCNCTWTSDILEWEAWRDIEPWTYDFIWASPPCQQYSIARTTAKTPRNFALADAIVARTLQIIEHLQPKGWLMENPGTGLLKTRGVVRNLPFVTVCYCMYSDGIDHRYRKPTNLWGGLPGFVPRPMCTRKAPCQFSLSGKHPCHAQRFPHSRLGDQHFFTLKQLYSMPKALCDDIARAAAALSSSQ